MNQRVTHLACKVHFQVNNLVDEVYEEWKAPFSRSGVFIVVC